MELEIIDLITQVGFPIAMCAYFVLKVEKVIQANTNVMMEIKELMENCRKRKI